MKVVLIGDSIRGGYQSVVARKFKGKAEVWWPADNCRHIVHTLDRFQMWIEDQKPDVLHINNGIHDAAYDVYGDGEPQILLEQYRLGLKRLVLLMKRRLPQTRMIWATTTPRYWKSTALPMEDWTVWPHIARYNDAAIEIMNDAGIPINDLNRLVMEKGFTRCICEDGAHMTPFGNSVLATAVVKAIRGAIG
jgi:lysophospholipase L1-like esterase